MLKSKLKIGTLVFSLVMWAHLLFPLSMNAQGGRSDGYFMSDLEGYENRDEVDWLLFGLITNDSFGAPLGSGLWVMAASCMAYALKRRRGAQRCVVASVIAVALVVGMTQCRKKEIVNDEMHAVNITLDVTGGAKTNVNPVTGVVTFEEGDQLIVANDKFYAGTLYYQDGHFSGSVTATSEDDYLHFYSLGKNITSILNLGRSRACNVSIADQDANMPVISYGHSTVKYSPDVTSYSARLENRCALVKFNVANGSPYAGVCIPGMNNKIMVNFEYVSFTCSKENDGNITLPPGSGERWAILLPQSEVAEGTAFAGLYTGTRGAVPEMHDDDFLTDGIPVTVETSTSPSWVKTGLFSVNSNGRQVRFAQGSVYYDKSKKKWNLMPDQHRRLVMGDYTTGVDNASIVNVEYHGWGANGIEHGAVNISPRKTSTDNNDYYAYGDASKNLYDENGSADWGYNIITNADKAYKQWRTITAEELAYIMEYRENAAEKYALATLSISTICYCGLIVLPDDWVAPYEGCFTPGITEGFLQNEYDATQWQQMSDSGVLFLPCSGMCYEGAVHGICTSGCYWTSSAYDAEHAYSLYFDETEVDWRRVTERHLGLSVRLLME